VRNEEKVSNENGNVDPGHDPPRAKKPNMSFRGKTPESKSVHDGTTTIQLKQEPVPLHYKATKELICTRPRLDMKNMTRHPALDAFGLDPSSADNFIVVIDNPEEEEHIIFCATSEVTVYETHIPYRCVKPQAPNTPFLKQGARGYDWENSKWYIPEHNDATDLHTGCGHQVGPADQEHMRTDPSFETEFLKKYPGLRAGAHQWPCGCHVAMNEYDSKEE
jgi:hypothetical protein